MIPWRPVIAVLLVAAGIGAVAQSADAGVLGRMAGVGAAAALIAVAVGAMRGRNWALGSGFFLGICWFWAAMTLRLQGFMSGLEATVWLAWSVTVIVATVRGRATLDE